MVGLVILSHSFKIAEGIRELAWQMAPSAPIAVSGGTKDGDLGSNMENILNSIEGVYSEDGVIVLFDLGSTGMNAKMALEFMPQNKKKKVYICDSALVEGSIIAAVEIELKKSLEEIKNTLKETSLKKFD